ncbi:hypothetical protein KBB25_00360 [Candidatus Gracilibacteria bacterium]|nr:hypothetical protein [Candidatus Gracilibacteria bacterium]
MQSLLSSLSQSAHDTLYKNMEWTNEQIYLLYDRESPLAILLSDAYRSILPSGSIDREFISPPQPLYRGGLINPDNPYAKSQNRVMTNHNLEENKKTGLDHHETVENIVTEEVDPQVELIKDALLSLPKGSIVVLIQSTNFRLSTFRIRLELFHRGVHVVEYNHLAYIPESEHTTFANSLTYRTPEYVSLQNQFSSLLKDAQKICIHTVNGEILEFGSVEKIRGNTGDYTGIENKGGTFPLGEVFTEAVDLESVSGKIYIDTFPREDFSIAIVEPFLLTVERGRVLPSSDFPPDFQKIYDYIVQFEGEVRVRELGFGLNPSISTTSPLSDINFHERKLGVHLSLGKKHGIFGKKFPKTELQRFHIDVFAALQGVSIDGKEIFYNNRWIF